MLIRFQDAEERRLVRSTANLHAAKNRADRDAIVCQSLLNMASDFALQCYNSHTNNCAMQMATNPNLPEVLLGLAKHTFGLPSSHDQAYGCSHHPEQD